MRICLSFNPESLWERAQFSAFGRILFAAFFFFLLISGAGCSTTGNLALQGQVSNLQSERTAIQNERDAWKNRYDELSNSNRLQTLELASRQQQVDTLKQEQLVLQKQLKDTLEQVAAAQKQAEHLTQQLAQYEDIRRQQESGTQITSNSSINAGVNAAEKAEMMVPTIPGTMVTSSGGKINVKIPGDELFEESGVLSPRGLSLIRQAGQIIASYYPGARIDIQGHCSKFQKVSVQYADAKQQTMSQAMAVRDVFVQEKILPDKLLNVTACGANLPINSSATAKGSQGNYRIELVISPVSN